MANKIKKSPSRVYVLTGDGEFCEGTMWESCLLAASRGLDNLTVVIDDNDSVGAMVNLGDMEAKLGAFGFDVLSVDGHDLGQLEYAFANGMVQNGKPKAVIAKSIRGYGSKTLTDLDVWFHKAPDVDELQMLMQEVDAF